MKIIYAWLTLAIFSTCLTACFQDTSSGSIGKPNKPNIVIFYVDDLGYGDLGSYGAKGVETPNVDKLAENGIRYTDAHSSSATCTPSRYSLLTGEYAFRNSAKVLKGDAKLIIKPGTPTLPNMLKKAGYTTAVVGKWHLGLGDGDTPTNWNEEIKPGPLEIGFDYSYLLPATGDRVPTVYMENYRVEGLDPLDPITVSYVEKIGSRPVGRENPDLLRQPADDQHADSIINGISRIGYMKGGKSAEWVDEDFHTVFTDKANDFIQQNSDQSFFLFFSFHDIHVPRLPNKRFQGKSSMGVRGDAIVQMDWITGEIVKQLEISGVLDNTIIIFTSDNGPVLTDGYEDFAIQSLGEHKPSGVFRGGKYSAYEAGTRVPTIIHYPAKITPGVSDALISQIDIYASIANLLQIPMAKGEAIDSENQLAALLDAEQPGRKFLIEESYTLSLRDGNLKYIKPTKNTGDWIKTKKNIEAGMSLKAQLFDLNTDRSEQYNIASERPDEVSRLASKLEQMVAKTQR